MSGAAELGQLGSTLTVDANNNVSVPNTFSMGSSFLRNRIINGCCRVAQRGALTITGNSTPSIYGGCDRITALTFGYTTASGTLQQSGSGFGAFGLSQAIVALTTTGTGGITFGQRIEANNCKDLNSTTVTVQAKVWQNTGSSQTAFIRLNKANAADNFSGVTVISTSAGSTVASSTLTTITATFTLGATDATNGLLVEVFYALGALTARDFHITDFQLEAGSAATPFERRQYGQELALCQRYYVRSVGVYWIGYGTAATIVGTSATLPVQMRATPTVSQLSSANTNTGANSVGADGSLNVYAQASVTATGGATVSSKIIAEVEL